MRRSPTDRVCEELRGSMVEVLFDAVRMRREFDKSKDRAVRKEKLRLVRVAVAHALELADQHLTLQGE